MGRNYFTSLAHGHRFVHLPNVLALTAWACLVHTGERAYTAALALGLRHTDITFILIGLMPMLVFITFGAVQYVLDTSSYFAAFRARRKVQTNFVPQSGDYAKAAWIAARNWLLLGLPGAAALSYYVLPWRGATVGPEMPSFFTLFKHLPVYLFAVEVLFFYSHWALHQPPFYALIHKVRFP